MPELPEVEHIRRSLDPWIVGAEILSVLIRRRDVVHLAEQIEKTSRVVEESLGRMSRIVATHRHGKQLGIECSSGRAIIVQLGMTGGVLLERDAPLPLALQTHCHVVWTIQPKAPAAQPWKLHFRDPRRFGRITGHASMEQLRASWAQLGPDAITITTSALLGALERTSRPVKSALLDQTLIAGVGNIYADEALFFAKVNPLQVAREITRPQAGRLSQALRSILAHAVKRGGSTLRDYRDAFNKAGTAAQLHAVYGRAGQPCACCGHLLIGTRLQGRATVFCPCCQDLSTIPRALPR